LTPQGSGALLTLVLPANATGGAVQLVLPKSLTVTTTDVPSGVLGAGSAFSWSCLFKLGLETALTKARDLLDWSKTALDAMACAGLDDQFHINVAGDGGNLTYPILTDVARDFLSDPSGGQHSFFGHDLPSNVQSRAERWVPTNGSPVIVWHLQQNAATTYDAVRTVGLGFYITTDSGDWLLDLYKQ